MGFIRKGRHVPAWGQEEDVCVCVCVCRKFDFHIFHFKICWLKNNPLYEDEGRNCDYPDHTGSERAQNSLCNSLPRCSLQCKGLLWWLVRKRGWNLSRNMTCTQKLWGCCRLAALWQYREKENKNKPRSFCIWTNIDFIISRSMWKHYLPAAGERSASVGIWRQMKGNLFRKSISPQQPEGLFGKGLPNEHTRLRRFVGACNLANCALAILQRD